MFKEYENEFNKVIRSNLWNALQERVPNNLVIQSIFYSIRIKIIRKASWQTNMAEKTNCEGKRRPFHPLF
jgi:hypothetical protein